MTLSQFNCPHCRSPFQVDTSLPSLQVACPHCRQPVELISEPPVAEPPLAAPPVLEPPAAAPAIAELPPRIPSEYSPTDLLPPSAVASPKVVVSADGAAPQQTSEHDTIADDYLTHQLAAEERASRKFVKNMIVWVCCAIVLVSILAFFVMKG